jgi:hypothetical protein
MVEIKDEITMALAKSVDGGKMTLEQVPIPYREAVENKVNQGETIN